MPGFSIVQASAITAANTDVIISLPGCTLGNSLIFLGEAQSSSVTAPTVVDTAGTPLLAIKNGGFGGSTVIASVIYYEDNISAGTHQFTMHQGATQRNSIGLLLEVSGLLSTGSFDTQASAQSSTAQSLASGSAGACTGADGNVAFYNIGVGSSSGIANIGLTDPASGWTSLGSQQSTASGVTAFGAGYLTGLVAGNTPSASLAWTDANTRQGTITLATFKLAPAGGGGGPNYSLTLQPATYGMVFSDAAAGNALDVGTASYGIQVQRIAMLGPNGPDTGGNAQKWRRKMSSIRQ